MRFRPFKPAFKLPPRVDDACWTVVSTSRRRSTVPTTAPTPDDCARAVPTALLTCVHRAASTAVSTVAPTVHSVARSLSRSDCCSDDRANVGFAVAARTRPRCYSTSRSSTRSSTAACSASTSRTPVQAALESSGTSPHRENSPYTVTTKRWAALPILCIAPPLPRGDMALRGPLSSHQAPDRGRSGAARPITSCGAFIGGAKKTPLLCGSSRGGLACWF